MAQSKSFYYSKKNTKPFCVPEQYSRYVKNNEKRQTQERRIKKNDNKKDKGFNTNSLIRAIAFVVMAVSLLVIVDRSNDYLRDIEFNKTNNEKFEINSQPNELLSKREPPLYPVLPEGNVTRLDYPDIFDPESIAQFSIAYKDFRFYIYMPMKRSTIKYPVFQSDDNEYYLKRNYDGEPNLSGTLYLDYRNDFETLRQDDMWGTLHRNNIVYGHNMQNGTMFGTLKEYADREFFNSNNMIYTYSATEVTAWKIFSAYETTTENYYIDTTFGSEAEYVSFLNKLKNDSLHPSDVALDASSDILTLSTCHKYDDPRGRFVIHAVKIARAPLV